MVTTKRFKTRCGSGSGAGRQIGTDEFDDRIREILHREVVAIIRDQVLELFGSIMTAMMDFFDDRYTAMAENVVVAASVVVVAVGVRQGLVFQYWDFNNTKPPNFIGVQDLIVAMRWLSDVEGCFFTCSCAADQKVRCALNLLRSRVKDWWRLVTCKINKCHVVVCHIVVLNKLTI